MYLFQVIASLFVCFGLQWVVMQASDGRTTKSESNYFSSVGRIQAGTAGEPQIMFLGSSITGRLPDRANGYSGTVNMGCDGGNAIDLVRAIDEGRVPTAPVLVIETNTLELTLRRGEGEVARAIRGRWFEVGCRFPQLSAHARPAAFLYSALLTRRTGAFDGGEFADLGGESVPRLGVFPPIGGELTAAQTQLVGELSERIKRLKSRGSRVVFVWLPPGRPDDKPLADWVKELVSTPDSEWWDVGEEADPGRVRLTDAIHMDAPSAARTMRTLVDGIMDTPPRRSDPDGGR